MKKILVALLVLGCSLGFVACGSNKKKVVLEVPSELVVENQYISFNEVENASYYNIYYDGHNWTVPATDNKEIVLDASKIFNEVKTYEVKVKALGEGKYLDSEYTASVFYERTENIGVPNLLLNQRTLSWSVLDNVNRYTIMVTFPDQTSDCYTYTSNSFDISVLLTDVGVYSFQVKAGEKESANAYSPKVSYSYEKSLTTPTGLSLVKETDDIYLYFITDAETKAYSLSVNDTEYEITDSLAEIYVEENGYKNYKKLRLSAFLSAKGVNLNNIKEFDVAIKSNNTGLENYKSSGWSIKEKLLLKERLDSPKVSMASGVLSWSQVNNATGYTIYKNFEFFASVEANTTSMVFNSADIAGDVFSVQAIGVGEFVNSMLATVNTTLPLNRGGLFTSNVTLPTSYESHYVEVCSDNFCQAWKLEGTETSFDFSAFINYGEYLVNVTSIKSGSTPYLSSYTLNYKKVLEVPNNIRLSNYVLKFDKVEHAIGYEVEINNIKVDTLYTTNSIDLTKYILASDQYSIKLRAIASKGKGIFDGSFSISHDIVHVQQLKAPVPNVVNIENKYLVKFEDVGASAYTILVNHIPIYQGESYKSEGYDISSYLTSAQEYTIMVKALSESEDYTDSEYGITSVKKYIQLSVINGDKMTLSNSEGRYWLNFDMQTYAGSYDIRIYHIEQDKEQKFNVSSVPCDVTNYVQLGGTYKVYVTALADSGDGYLYLSSQESGNPLVFVQPKTLLNKVGNVGVEKQRGVFNLTWDSVEHADKYFITISYSNSAEPSREPSLIYEGYASVNNYSLDKLVLKEGQYNINIKPISESMYDSPSFTNYTYNHIMTISDDFVRNVIMYNGNKYSHYVTDYTQLENLLHYYYLYDDVRYQEGLENYNLKFMLSPAVTIEVLNEQCENLNAGFIAKGETYVEKMFNLAECAINNYKERSYFRINQPFSAPKYITGTYENYYIFNYQTGLSKEKINYSDATNNLLINSHKTVANALQRSENYIYKLELNEKIDVSTTEQLFMAVQAGYAPNFVGDCTIAKTVYNKAKEVLNANCTDEMSDYEKVEAIYLWITSNVNYNYEFERYYSTSKSIGDFTDLSNTTRIGEMEDAYLEGVFINRKATSNGLAKAFVLLCALEGINTTKVNGTKTTQFKAEEYTEQTPVYDTVTYHYYWNKVYLDCSLEDDLDNPKWLVVDVASGYQKISIDGTIYNVGGLQYFLVSDSHVKAKLGVTENYNYKNVFTKVGDQEVNYNYYANKNYNYSKLIIQGTTPVNKTGSCELKYQSNEILADYLKGVLGYLFANAKAGNSYWTEIDVSSSPAQANDICNMIAGSGGLYSSVSSEWHVANFKLNAISSNGKILIALMMNSNT